MDGPVTIRAVRRGLSIHLLLLCTVSDVTDPQYDDQVYLSIFLTTREPSPHGSSTHITLAGCSKAQSPSNPKP